MRSVFLLMLTFALHSYALEFEHTARGSRSNACCAPTATVQTPTAPAAAPVQTPQLYQGPPGAKAQIGAAEIVDIRAEETETVYTAIPYFKNVLVEEKYTVKVPQVRPIRVPHLEYENRVETRQRVDQVYHPNFVTKTTPYTYHYQTCNACGGWQTHTGTGYTTSTEDRSYFEDRISNYTVNRAEPVIRYHTENEPYLVDQERQRLIEKTIVDKKYIQKKSIVTTYTVRQTAISEVPKAEGEAAIGK